MGSSEVRYPNDTIIVVKVPRNLNAKRVLEVPHIRSHNYSMINEREMDQIFGEMILDKNGIAIEAGELAKVDGQDGDWLVLGYDGGKVRLAELGNVWWLEGENIEIKN